MTGKSLTALLAASLVVGVTAQDPQEPPASTIRRPVVVGRSKVATTYGIVAASQPLGSRGKCPVCQRARPRADKRPPADGGGDGDEEKDDQARNNPSNDPECFHTLPFDLRRSTDDRL